MAHYFRDGKRLMFTGKAGTDPACCDACTPCYYLRPAKCCDDAPGPVRYRVRSDSALLATFAASGDPLFIVIRPAGFVLGTDYTTTGGGAVAVLESSVEAECWIVELSTECDAGELLEWVEFTGEPLDDPSGGEYAIDNIADATVLYDPEFFPAPEECEDSNPDNCPVIVCGQCVSASSVITGTINALVHSDYLSADVELDRTTTGTPGCAASSSVVQTDPANPSLYPSPDTNVSWVWQVNCDGSGSFSVLMLSWEDSLGVLRGQAAGTFDAAGNVTPTLEVAMTLPATVTASWSIASPVAWTKVGDECLVEEAP